MAERAKHARFVARLMAEAKSDDADRIRDDRKLRACCDPPGWAFVAGGASGCPPWAGKLGRDRLSVPGLLC